MLRYDDTYRESVRLGDGTLATLRLVTPEDRPLMTRGFDAMSAETRYNRFFAHKRALTKQDLDYLTQLDGLEHFALGAVLEIPAGPVQPLGIARFIRDAGGRTAEAAVVVVDEHQNQGLGRVLLERLGEAAHERGIESLHLTTLADNRALQRLVCATFSHVDAGQVRDGTRTFVAHLAHGAGHPVTQLRRTATHIAEAKLRMLEAVSRVLRK